MAKVKSVSYDTSKTVGWIAVLLLCVLVSWWFAFMFIGLFISWRVEKYY